LPQSEFFFFIIGGFPNPHENFIFVSSLGIISTLPSPPSPKFPFGVPSKDNFSLPRVLHHVWN